MQNSAQSCIMRLERIKMYYSMHWLHGLCADEYYCLNNANKMCLLNFIHVVYNIISSASRKAAELF